MSQQVLKVAYGLFKDGYLVLSEHPQITEVTDPDLLAFQQRCDELCLQYNGARYTFTIPTTGQYVITELSWFFLGTLDAQQFAGQVESEFGSEGRRLLAERGYMDGLIPEPTVMVDGYSVGWNTPLPPPPPPGEYETQEGCEAAGYYWYDGVCHGAPKEASWLDKLVYSWNTLPTWKKLLIISSGVAGVGTCYFIGRGKYTFIGKEG